MSLRRLPTRNERAVVASILAGTALASGWFAVSFFLFEPRNPMAGGLLALFALCFFLMAKQVFFGKVRIPSRRARHVAGLAMVVSGAAIFILFCVDVVLHGIGQANRGIVVPPILLVSWACVNCVIGAVEAAIDLPWVKMRE